MCFDDSRLNGGELKSGRRRVGSSEISDMTYTAADEIAHAPFDVREEVRALLVVRRRPERESAVH